MHNCFHCLSRLTLYYFIVKFKNLKCLLIVCEAVAATTMLPLVSEPLERAMRKASTAVVRTFSFSFSFRHHHHVPKAPKTILPDVAEILHQGITPLKFSNFNYPFAWASFFHPYTSSVI